MGYEQKINRALAEAAGSSGICDAFGRELHEGDKIILMVDPVYATVQAIAPVLDPTAPPGLLKIALIATYQFVAPRSQRNHEFIRVLTAAENVLPKEGA